MPKATRLGDNDTGHDACGPTALVTASTDVIINGKGAGRVGDSYAPHGCIAHPTHSGVIASGRKWAAYWAPMEQEKPR